MEPQAQPWSTMALPRRCPSCAVELRRSTPEHHPILTVEPCKATPSAASSWPWHWLASSKRCTISAMDPVNVPQAPLELVYGVTGHRSIGEEGDRGERRRWVGERETDEQGRTGKSGGPVRNYELGPSTIAAACECPVKSERWKCRCHDSCRTWRAVMVEAEKIALQSVDSIERQ